MKNKSSFSISEFWLKIIGYFTMTIDHLGVFLEMSRINPELAEACRCIGRIAFPLFVFMLVEGIMHTKHFGKYILRLSILAIILTSSVFIISTYFDNSFNMSNPITDLVFLALTIYLINRKDKYSFFAVLPAAYMILCFVVGMIEYNNRISVEFLPIFLRCDYDIFGLALALLFYAVNPLSKVIVKQDNIENEETTQICKNILSCLVIIAVAITFALLNKYTGKSIGSRYVEYACIAGIPLLIYSGKRGYNKKWFQYGCYFYFPLHIVVLFAIFFFAGLI